MIRRCIWSYLRDTFLGFQIPEILMASNGQDASLHQISSKSVKQLRRYGSFLISQDGGCPPSWICLSLFWTTREAYLVVFTGVQNLVEIDAVVLIIWNFKYFAHMTWKCLFMPPKLRFLGIWPVNGKIYQQNFRRHILAWKNVIWRTDRQNQFTSVTCARDEETKKTKKKLSGKLGIRLDHPRRMIQMPFGVVDVVPAVVISFKFHQNWLSGYRAVRGRNLAYLST